MDPLEAYLIDDVSHGSLTLNLDGSFSYTPDFRYVGQDSFTYYVTDGIADSNTATVTIDVFNDIPSAGDDVQGMPGGGGSMLAVDDFYFAMPDTPYSEPAPGVLWNDTLVPGATSLKVDDPDFGIVDLSADGSFLYTPDPGFYGLDTFTYQLSDGIDLSNVATVEIQVGNPEPLLAAGRGGDGTFERLQRSQLVAIVDQAIAQWDAVILDPGVRRAMREVDFRVADLPGNALGWAFPTMIAIDADAAGYGWFIDATPGANEEFRFNSSTGQYEATAGPAADRMDLLTVVLHELGHVAGLDDAGEPGASATGGQPGDVMLPTLDLGVRRLPDEGHAFQFLSQRAAALIARLPDDLRSLTLPARREFRRELDSLLSQIGRQRAAIQASRPAAEVDSLDSYFATLRDRKELVLWG